MRNFAHRRNTNARPSRSRGTRAKATFPDGAAPREGEPTGVTRTESRGWEGLPGKARNQHSRLFAAPRQPLLIPHIQDSPTIMSPISFFFSFFAFLRYPAVLFPFYLFTFLRFPQVFYVFPFFTFLRFSLSHFFLFPLFRFFAFFLFYSRIPIVSATPSIRYTFRKKARRGAGKRHYGGRVGGDGRNGRADFGAKNRAQ